MRSVLTLLAVALVALLTAALIGPLLVDWSAHRGEIEARIGTSSGGHVTLTGPITLRLLPIPYLELGEGSAAGPGPDQPRLSFKSARLELALVKLASGVIRFTEIRLERPVLTLTRRPNGSLFLPLPPTKEADAVGFDRLVVRGGEIRILAAVPGPVRTIGGIDLDADAPSLAGPYRGSGKFDDRVGAPVAFLFASEAGNAAGTPIHIVVDAGPFWPSLVFDGALEFVGDGKVPDISGSATLTGSAAGPAGPLPWRLTGSMRADLDAARLANGDLRIGPEERAVRAEVDATLGYGLSARLFVTAKVKHANVDSLLRRKGEDGVPPERAVAVLTATLGPALKRMIGLTVEADVTAGDVTLGSETMSDLSASVQAVPGAPLKTRFDMDLPGGSRFGAEGELETGLAPKFRGEIDFSTDDLPLLCNWASKGAPDFAARAAAVGDAFSIRRASFSGAVEASSVGLSGRSLVVTLGRSVMTGSLAFTRRVDSEPGRLLIDLSSDSLDVAALPTLSAGQTLFGDLDLSVALRAKSLHVSHVGEGEIDSGSLALKIEKSGPKATLQQLSVADLGGASVEAQGSYGPEGLEATGHLSAAKLHDFAFLISSLTPGGWSKVLAERALRLSPASLAFEVRGGSAPDGNPVLDSLRVSGSIEQTRVAFAVDPAPNGNGQTIALSLDAADSSELLRQLGIVGSPGTSGPAHIGLHAAGAWGVGYDVEATGALAGADVSASGRYVPTAEGDEARIFGSAKLKSANVVPLTSAVGLAPPTGTIGPVEGGADVTLRGDRWTISRLSATIASVRMKGELAYEPPTKSTAAPLATPDLALAEDAINGPAAAASQFSPPAVTGELSFDRLPLAGLIALALGPPQQTKSKAFWSESKFAPMPLNPPRVAVRVSAPSLDAADGSSAQAFSATLRLDKGRLDVDDMAMKIAEGAASGSVTFRRGRDSATISGTISAERLAINRAGFSGRIGGTVEFASTGNSPAGLIAGLAGGGELDLSGVEFARSDLAALDRVIARSQVPEAQLDETNIAYEFGQELSKAPLRLPDGATPLSLSAGTIKLGPLTIAGPHADATLSASFDLVRLSLETRLVLTSPSADLRFWSGPPPIATVTVQSALSAPRRQLDVAALSAALATQAIARETDRIANLEADIRERAFFNRRLKGERFMDRRNAEIEDWRAEQARLKGLSERLEAERMEAEKAAAERAAAEKAEAPKPFPQPELSPDPSSDPTSAPRPSSADTGINSPTPHAAVPLPPLRSKPRPLSERKPPPANPTAGALY